MKKTPYYINKVTFALLLFLVVTITGSAKPREVHILAVNDVHAAIDQMPLLAGVVDSLRSLYPSLLVFSAGDNRTGNPINDLYQPSGYPMVALMNQIGFNASALGNHEFDNFSLPEVCRLSAFRYICANIQADDSTGVSTVPYQLFDAEGLRIGVVGAIQINKDGIPDAHPDVLQGLHFESPFTAVPRYEWLRRQCDAVILLSHVGYQDEVRLAEQNPWIDVIIGGHTHRQLSEKEPLHGGVLVTQNRNLLGQCTHITLRVDSGRVVGKTADYISLRRGRPNSVVQLLVQHFNDNPFFKRVLARAATPFDTRNEIGTMVCDAIMSQTGADIAIMNYRGIRITKMPDGNITVYDALQIDPFANNAVTMTMTGAQLEKFIVDYGRMNIYHFPHLGGMKADLTIDPKETTDITAVRLYGADGKPLARKKKYKVVTNSYILSTAHQLPATDIEVINTTTSDMVMDYLEQQKTVSYQGRGNLHYINPQKN